MRLIDFNHNLNQVVGAQRDILYQTHPLNFVNIFSKQLIQQIYNFNFKLIFSNRIIQGIDDSLKQEIIDRIRIFFNLKDSKS